MVENILGWIGVVTLLAALVGAISTPLILISMRREMRERLARVEAELASIEFSDGPDDPPDDDGEPDIQPSNIIAIGRAA